MPQLVLALCPLESNYDILNEMFKSIIFSRQMVELQLMVHSFSVLGSCN